MKRPASPAGWCAAAGIALLAVAVTGPFFARTFDAPIADGSTYRARDPFGRSWSFASQGISRLERDSNFVIALALVPTLRGVRQPMLTSEQREPMAADSGRAPAIRSIAGVQRTFLQDIRLSFAAGTPGVAIVHLTFTPFVAWGWTGAAIIAIGGLFAAVARVGIRPENPMELDAAAEEAIRAWRQKL